jgi:hypothetical protein
MDTCCQSYKTFFSLSLVMRPNKLEQGILKGEISLVLFDWFGLVCFANENKNCQLSYS